MHAMLPQQRRGSWAAIARGLLLLVATAVSPLLILSALLFFVFAWGIRRGQMWAAISAAAFLILPMPVFLWNRPQTGIAAIVFAVLLDLFFSWFFVQAAIALGRAGGGAAGRGFWSLFIVACAVFWVFVHPYAMPSASMEDTILTDENVFVRRTVAGPRNGDLILFHYPPDPAQTYIKRVAGIPGDRLRIVNKQLFRNGAPVDEPYVKHASSFVDPYRDNFPSQPESRLPAQGVEMLAANVRNGELVVPEGYYFVLGDNRDDSLDSRYWGFVARDQIVGRPFLVYASYNLSAAPQAPARTILDTRWNRLFKLL
jgi:signal peptidase I